MNPNGQSQPQKALRATSDVTRAATRTTRFDRWVCETVWPPVAMNLYSVSNAAERAVRLPRGGHDRAGLTDQGVADGDAENECEYAELD